MRKARLSFAIVLCAVFATAPLSSCASTEKDLADTAELKKRKKKKDGIPKNYSLFKKRELNQELLRRGQKAQAAPALDSY